MIIILPDEHPTMVYLTELSMCLCMYCVWFSRTNRIWGWWRRQFDNFMALMHFHFYSFITLKFPAAIFNKHLRNNSKIPLENEKVLWTHLTKTQANIITCLNIHLTKEMRTYVHHIIYYIRLNCMFSHCHLILLFSFNKIRMLNGFLLKEEKRIMSCRLPVM